MANDYLIDKSIKALNLFCLADSEAINHLADVESYIETLEEENEELREQIGRLEQRYNDLRENIGGLL